MTLEHALKYGAQIADALDKAHRSAVVPRDPKPGNIMLTSTGAKLLDFGLAKLAAALRVAATLSVSPEQVEGKELDGRSTSQSDWDKQIPCSSYPLPFLSDFDVQRENQIPHSSDRAIGPCDLVPS